MARGVKRLNTPGSESIFIKLSKDFFSFYRDVVVSFCYCVPSGSSYQTRTQFDPFEDFEQKLCNASVDCDLVALGDFNARTALKPDYIESDDNSDIPVMDELFAADRISAHQLGVETMRYKRPPVPHDQRYCAYCPAGSDGSRAVDTEVHCLTGCTLGDNVRQELYNIVGSSNSVFCTMSNNDKFKILVCPTNPVNCKAVNRYLQSQFNLRDSIDAGECNNPG